MLALCMNYLRPLFLTITIASFFFLIVGLYKPWVMLWWEDVQNRRKIIKLYGGMGITSALLYWLLIM